MKIGIKRFILQFLGRVYNEPSIIKLDGKNNQHVRIPIFKCYTPNLQVINNFDMTDIFKIIFNHTFYENRNFLFKKKKKP